MIPHRRILRVSWHGDDDGRVAAVIDLAVPLPPNVARVLGWNWRTWSTGGFSGRYYAPDDNDRPLALCQLTLRIPLDARRLPEPNYHADGTPKVATAKEAAQLVTLQLNGVLREFLAATSTTRSAA